jgi:hypothetical protein
MESVQQSPVSGSLSSEISVHPISRTDNTGAVICDTGARVEVLGRELGLSYRLPEDHIAPIFSGTAWAGTMVGLELVVMHGLLACKQHKLTEWQRISCCTDMGGGVEHM